VVSEQRPRQLVFWQELNGLASGTGNVASSFSHISARFTYRGGGRTATQQSTMEGSRRPLIKNWRPVKHLKRDLEKEMQTAGFSSAGGDSTRQSWTKKTGLWSVLRCSDIYRPAVG